MCICISLDSNEIAIVYIRANKSNFARQYRECATFQSKIMNCVKVKQRMYHGWVRNMKISIAAQEASFIYTRLWQKI